MRTSLIAVVSIAAFAVSATINYASEPKPGHQGADAYDLTGMWNGRSARRASDFGEVGLKDTKEGYIGTYTATYDGRLGSVAFKRGGPRTYTGLFWNSDLRRYGSLQLDVAEDGLSIGLTWKALDNNYPLKGGESTWKRVVVNSPKDGKVVTPGDPLFTGVEQEDNSPWPCIVMVYHVESMLPGRGESGLRMAIWEDGSILMQPYRSGISEHILIGNLDGEDLETAFKSIVQTGLFSGSREHYVVPDSEFSTLMIRTKTESKVRSWHGKLLPGFGGSLNTDEEYRKFVKMWKASESTLLALTPVKVERLAEHLKKSGATHFRGYNPQSPFEAPWMHKRNWRDQESTSEKRGKQ